MDSKDKTPTARSDSKLATTRTSSSRKTTTPWIATVFWITLASAAVLQIVSFDPAHHNTEIHHPLQFFASEWKVVPEHEPNNKPKEESDVSENPAHVNVNNVDDPDDKQRILDLLKTAGVHFENAQELAEATKALPSWKDMVDLYGNMDTPVILGQESCEAYRAAVPVAKRYAAVAGMFNTGTNAMTYHLQHNLDIHMKWQIPWGKHRVPSVRLSHVAPGMQGVDQKQALPVVMIRDPFHWMQSMCKQAYAAKWKRLRKHCPNLVPTADEYEKHKQDDLVHPDAYHVKVFFDKQQIFEWDSLIHLWSDWYRQYLTADYPRLMVRFEDMLLTAPAVLDAIADCAGVTRHSVLKYQTASAKSHGSHTDFTKAITKSANAEVRMQGLTDLDLEFAAQHLDKELMETFHYQLPKLKSGNVTTDA